LPTIRTLPASPSPNLTAALARPYTDAAQRQRIQNKS
jgi:hypothetical protein